MSTCSRVSQSGQVVPDSSASKKINSLLNSSKSRLEGLQLLDLFLPQCPDEEFLNCCVGWMQNCCKWDGLTKNTIYPTHLLCKLLKTSSKYPELKKSVSFFITTRYFDFFFKYLLNSEVGWVCTETCLCLYRGACGSFQEALEKHLTLEIEKNVKIPSVAARCFALLPSTGGGGNEGLNFKRNWKSQFIKFLNKCHSILNDIFVDVEDFQLLENVGVADRPSGPKGSAEELAMPFQNSCSVLCFMLLNEYPAPKSVPSDLVFQLICRGLSANPRALRKRPKTTALSSLQKALPEIHCALLFLLKAVIVTCKNQLLPYSQLICKLIKQSLQWTESDFSHGKENPLCRVRISTYECLCDWLVIARSGSCMEAIAEVIVSGASTDVNSKEGAVFLKEAKPQNESKGRGQITRRPGAATTVQLCRSALRALQFLLKFTGVLLKAEVHKFLQEIVIKLLVEVQRGSSSNVASPFALPTHRVELYSLLLELVHQPCQNWPPPTNFAVKLFSTGLNDASPEVSSFCSGALNYTSIIIHPQFDNGGFPVCPTSPNGRIPGGEHRRREEPMEVVTQKGLEILRLGNANSAKSDEIDSSKKGNDGSEISSDEDSRNTVTFSKDMAEFASEAPGVKDGGEQEIVGCGGPAEVDGCNSGQRIVTEEFAGRKDASPVRENQPVGNSVQLRETPERNEVKKLSSNCHAQDPYDSKNISPESANEGDSTKRRYFLRSKTKGSSEEPEEALRRTNSAESLKGTPAKSVSRTTPSVQSSAKRPRTRAVAKTEGNGEAEPKAGYDDEEDIRAAFDDSFLD